MHSDEEFQFWSWQVCQECFQGGLEQGLKGNASHHMGMHLVAEQANLSCFCSRSSLCYPQCDADTFIMLVNWISKKEGKQVVFQSSQFNLIYCLISQMLMLAQSRSSSDVKAGRQLSWGAEACYKQISHPKSFMKLYHQFTLNKPWIFFEEKQYQEWQILPSLLQGHQWRGLSRFSD